MKTMMKLFLMIALLGSTAMADGDMGNGGLQSCTVNCPPPPCTENCFVAPTNTVTDTTADVILVVVKKYLGLSL